jgi:hypothetical protein
MKHKSRFVVYGIFTIAMTIMAARAQQGDAGESGGADSERSAARAGHAAVSDGV